MCVIVNNNTDNNLDPSQIYGAAKNLRNQYSRVNYDYLFLFQVIPASKGGYISLFDSIKIQYYNCKVNWPKNTIAICWWFHQEFLSRYLKIKTDLNN